MIPSPIDIGSIWPVLPPGIHWATMKEITAAFAYNERRRHLLEGFDRAISNLRGAGCSSAYLDGSFVTGKPDPGDFDGCWDPLGVIAAKLDPVLLVFDNKRAAQKAKYFGEMFPTTAPATRSKLYIDFFQEDKFTSKPKGIVGIKL
jgi:hypothetical protein